PRLEDVLLGSLERRVAREEGRRDDLPRAGCDPRLALLQDPIRLGPRLSGVERVVRPLVPRIRLLAGHARTDVLRAGPALRAPVDRRPRSVHPVVCDVMAVLMAGDLLRTDVEGARVTGDHELVTAVAAERLGAADALHLVEGGDVHGEGR